MNADMQVLLKVRIGDINYGGHLGHDRLITLLHQARIEFLLQLEANEQQCFGVGLIMRHLQCDYLAEAFLHDELCINMTISHIRKIGFTVHYQISRDETIIAVAETQMIAFDYHIRKVIALPETFIHTLEQYRKDKEI